jgi:hypothetical protein
MIQHTLDWFDAFVAAHHMDAPEDNARLELKREHCLLVMNEAREQARELGLSARLVELSTVAGLCHDVGRFPQYRRFRTFRDSDSANHGLLGVTALARTGGLTWLEPRDRHLVRLAVAVHNRKALPPAIAATHDDDAGLLVRIVRDADKLDILRVMIEHFKQPGPKDPVVFLGLPDDADRYDPAMLAAIETGQTARYEAMTTVNDFALLLLSWINSLEFNRARRLFFERGHVRDLFSFLPDKPELASFADRYQSRFAPRPTAT